MKKVLALVLVVALVLSLGLTACQKAEDPAPADQGTTPTATDAPQEPKVLRVVSDEPPALDPQIGTDSVSIRLNNLLLDGLVRVHAGKIYPGMAKEWEISEDGLTYTFHLRDAKWNDGIPVTAQDFEYSWIRLLEPATASEYAFQGYYLLNGEEYNTGAITDKTQVGVKAIDEKTLEVKLKAPCTYFLSLAGFLSFLPARQDMVEQYGEAYGTDVEKMVYNGPFLLTEWNHDADFAIEKNDDYWNKDEIKLDKIEYTIVVDTTTAVNMYEAGDIDIVGLNGDHYIRYKGMDKALTYSDGSEFYLEVNNVGKTKETGKLLGNVKFRQAIGFAIDRQALITAVYKNDSIPATRFVTPDLMGAKEKFSMEHPYQFYAPNADIEKAKKLLDEALVEVGVTVDQLPTFGLLNYEGDNSRLFGEAIADMLLKNLGIKIEQQQVQFKQKLQMATDKDFDLNYAGWGPDYDDAMTFIDLFVSDGGHNNTSWANDRFDELVKGAKVEPDPIKRGQMMAEAEKIVVEGVPVIPIYFRYRNWTKQDYVKNVIRNSIGADPDFIYTDIVK